VSETHRDKRKAATIQAARDLYGANSNAERAITQAWTAVGVN
jgi:Zn-dependent metalloprotease